MKDELLLTIKEETIKWMKTWNAYRLLKPSEVNGKRAAILTGAKRRHGDVGYRRKRQASRKRREEHCDEKVHQLSFLHPCFDLFATRRSAETILLHIYRWRLCKRAVKLASRSLITYSLCNLYRYEALI